MQCRKCFLLRPVLREVFDQKHYKQMLLWRRVGSRACFAAAVVLTHPLTIVGQVPSGLAPPDLLLILPNASAHAPAVRMAVARPFANRGTLANT
jgi:hypothetical protein